METDRHRHRGRSFVVRVDWCGGLDGGGASACWGCADRSAVGGETRVGSHCSVRTRAHSLLKINLSPFCHKRKDGSPYLETHHTGWLAEGGADTVDNTVALCPNCQKKMHVINSKERSGFAERGRLERRLSLTY